MSQLKIREMPREERPREKLAAHGASALTDPELIAILLRTGVPGANAIEVARKLLKDYGSLAGLSRCTVDELAGIRGIGPAKAVQLVAAFGLGQRLARETLSKQKIDSPELVNELVGPEMRRLRKESLRVILLDTRYHLIRVEEVSIGSVNESIAHPRDIFRPALVSSAYAVIVVHNHPSGDASPSQTDHSLTRRLAEAAELLQIKLLDHIIIGAPARRKPRLLQLQGSRRAVKIHPTALVDPGARIGADVEIGPFSTIGPEVAIGDNTIVQSHVVIEGEVAIGTGNFIGHGAVIGAPPQDVSFSPERKTRVEIGNENVIREYCTIHRGSAEGSATKIGDNNFLMAGCASRSQLRNRKQCDHRQQLFARRSRSRGQRGISRRRWCLSSIYAHWATGTYPRRLWFQQRYPTVRNRG